MTQASSPQSPTAGPGSSPRSRILIVEDDRNFGMLLDIRLREQAYEPALVTSGEEALERLDALAPAVVLLDIGLPGRQGPEILEELKRTHPDLPVVMMTAAGTIELAVECMKGGAYDFLTKPFEIERLAAILRNATDVHALRRRVQELEGALARRHSFDGIVAHSAPMQRVLGLARRAALADTDVLVLGESGTGKEVLARSIHFNSGRRRGPFVAINCGAIPEGLLESELFGHEKGSFTGAISRRAGCLEQAQGGTLFLDEIAEMRPDMQVRLLRALEQREVRRVGGDQVLHVDVRVISATNQDMRARLQDGRFRTDLYYRLAILILEVPPLRERPEDIGPLALCFLREVHREGQTHATSLSKEALELLQAYPWPGNVRELRNAVERAMVFEDSPAIMSGSLPVELVRVAQARLPEAAPVPAPAAAAQPPGQAAPPVPAAPPSTRLQFPAPTPTGAQTVEQRESRILPMEEEERKVILRALELTCGNVSEAARRLGVHRSTLHRKMARYGMATEEAETAGELAHQDSGGLANE